LELCDDGWLSDRWNDAIDEVIKEAEEARRRLQDIADEIERLLDSFGVPEVITFELGVTAAGATPSPIASLLSNAGVNAFSVSGSVGISFNREVR
jgi:hypothetical protein